MAHSLSKIYVHLIFSTKDRVPVLRREHFADIHKYIAGTLTRMDCQALTVGGMPDHVHVLFVLGKSCTIAKTVENLKRAATQYVRTLAPCYRNFTWQEGYGAFSVSPTRVDAVTQYINNQEQHHTKITFTEELKRFFDEYGVKYDERYL